MKILLYSGTSFISRAIRWQTRSNYSHAAILFDDGVIIESKEFKGVVKRGATSDELANQFSVAVPIDDKSVREFCEAQVGKAYDYGSVLRFISRRQEDRSGSGKWFCSELVFAACLKGGVRLLHGVEPWAVSPGMLAFSPLLK